MKLSVFFDHVLQAREQTGKSDVKKSTMKKCMKPGWLTMTLLKTQDTLMKNNLAP